MNAEKRQLSPTKCWQENVLKKKRLLNDSGIQKPKNETVVEQMPDSFDLLFEDDSDFSLMALEAAGLAPETSSKKNELDLSSWKRCRVEAVERDPKTFDLVLSLSSVEMMQTQCSGYVDNATEVTNCHLQGPWCQTHVEVGDVLCLIAEWDEQLQTYKVNKDQGFCVTNPDTLISGTSVVGSLFCRRKAVLADRFRGVDPNSKIMVIGSMVHELLQVVLLKGLRSYEDIQDVAKELLKSQETAFTLYGSLMTREETELELLKFVPNILNFVQQYVLGQEPVAANQFDGTIAEIQDIEENLWVPQLGLKGKVDVSVRIKRNRSKAVLNFPTSNEHPLPLELKTGRASFSLEHKGQLILYQMMLTEAGAETRSGLLLYLREGILREIEGTHNEQRDLIILRNDLAHYLSRLPAADALSAPLCVGEGKLLQPFELPEPISHHSACGNCAYATLCCSFAQTDASLQLRPGHPLVKVMAESTAHLRPADYEYFMRWCALLTFEEREARNSNNLRALWTDSPDVRARQGRAIIGLELQGGVEYVEGRYLHTLQLRKQQNNIGKTGEDEEERQLLDLTLSGFSVGEYVIVSTAKRLAIAAGCIYDLSKATISISLERNLLRNYTGHSFIVDKHESQSGNVFNYTNLGLLLEDNERAGALRAIVVQREQPTFSTVLPKSIASACADVMKQLNAIQREAALKALTTNSFLLIKGLPGTGKTQTLVAIIRLLYLMGKSVLITSHTHSAVDNLMLRLKPHSLPMLRLGSGARINPQLRECGECTLTADCRTEADLARIYASYNIVGVTCLGAAHSIFLHRQFDVCIVDEATQVMQCTVLRPLFFAQKFILVGDPDQLPPLIRSKEARQRGADESLFHRLDSPTATKELTLQYRMNKTITKLANHLTYAGKLLCASKEVELAVMKPRPAATVAVTVAAKEKWLQRVVSAHIDQAVFFVDTGDCSERSYSFASTKHSSTCAAIELSFADGSSADSTKRQTSKRISKYTNYCDAAVVFQILRHLLCAGYDGDRIGVVAPYRAQVELLHKLAEQHAAFADELRAFAQVEVNTVDQYQGRDKDILIYSCTKTGAAAASGDVERARDAEILEDKRRLTVAITRSKHKLVLVGDSATLRQYTPFSALLARIPSYCKLNLEEGKLDFSWERVLARLSEVISS